MAIGVKPIRDCELMDVPEAIHCLKWHAEAVDKIYDQTAPHGDDAIAMILREPVGVVAAVLPWNFPLLMLAWKIGPALAAGTDMIGPYGYCADRSWVCGHLRMTEGQRGLYRAARDQIEHNLALVRPGTSFAEFNARSWRIPERHRPYRYSVAAHGVGMADEFETQALVTETGAERLDSFPREDS